MQNINTLMIEQINLLISNKDLLNEYKNLGFKLIWDINKSQITITYHQNKYEVSLIKHKDKFYWHLVPYNNSFFETDVENGINVVLFAIKENEQLYIKKG